VSPSEWSGEGWRITVRDTGVTVAETSGPITVPVTEVSRLDVRRRWFRWSLRFDGQPAIRLRGIRNAEASTLARALRRLALAPAIAEAAAWHTTVAELLARARTAQRWIPTETVDALLVTRPEPGLLARVRAAGLASSLAEAELTAAGSLERCLPREGGPVPSHGRQSSKEA
jgi:hypothetical protein